jgi:hypothetical protein
MPITAGMVSAASGLKNPAGAVELDYRVNLCQNPNFESASTYWTSNGALSVARSAEAAYEGTHSLKVALSLTTTNGAIYGNSNRIPVSPGESCRFSVYIKTAPDNAVGTYRLRVRTYTAVSGGSLIGNLSGTSISIDPDSEWTRLNYAPTLSDPGIAAVTLLVDRVSSTNANDIFYVDNVLFERSSTLKDYFDGSSPGAFWGGAENASISGITPY